MFQRPAGGNLSLEQKASIIALHHRNVPTREIALEIGCHRNTVLKWTTNFRQNFDVLRKVESGRPRKTTAAQDVKLLHAVRAKPFTTLQELKGILFFIHT